MKVSIIVPVYNVEEYLEKCLDSLVLQTLDDIEIIAVNDGSKDGSQQILERYQENYPSKLKIYNKINGGLSDARNFGIDRASGDYIGFVDSDDFVTHNMFLDMWQLAEKHKAEIVVCNLQKVNEKGEVTREIPQIPNMPEKILLKDNLSIFSDLGCFACNKLFRKELFNNHRFKKGVHFEDIQLIPQLILESTVVAQTQSYHYQYFERSASISKAFTVKGLDMLDAVRDVEVFYHHSRYSDNKLVLKNFQILEGVYSFLAYLAYVDDKKSYKMMKSQFLEFCKERSITTKDILNYKRFGKNYLLGLSLKKIIYYILVFSGFDLSIFKK